MLNMGVFAGLMVSGIIVSLEELDGSLERRDSSPIE